MKKLLTFVMAGGRGERLWPLTKDRAKPAVPFGGIYRIIDFTLSNCINSGIRRIYILTQYKSISLSRHLRMGWYIFDSELGDYIEIIPAQQRVGEQWYQGTADSIYQNLYTIETENPDYVLILAGDHIYKMDYSRMLRFHLEKKADVTIGVVKVEKERGCELGTLEVEEDSRVVAFQEKPQQPKTIPSEPGYIFASMGIYLFNREVLERELNEDAGRESEHDFGKNIIPGMVSSSRVFSYNFVDPRTNKAKYWRDVGSIDAYWKANMDLVSITPIFNLYDKNWPIRTYQEQFPPTKMVFSGEDDSRRVGRALNSLLSQGCIISGGLVQSSVLSPNVRVNSFAQVYDSIIMEGVNVGRYAKIKKAIIDKDITIPEGLEIGCNPDADRERFMVTDSGIVVVSKGTKIEVNPRPFDAGTTFML